MTLEQVSAGWEYFKREFSWFAGLIATITAAVLGQAELIGEPWRHWITVTFIVATAIVAYNIRSFTASKEKARQELSETQMRDLSALVRAARAQHETHSKDGD